VISGKLVVVWIRSWDSVHGWENPFVISTEMAQSRRRYARTFQKFHMQLPLFVVLFNENHYFEKGKKDVDESNENN